MHLAAVREEPAAQAAAQSTSSSNYRAPITVATSDLSFVVRPLSWLQRMMPGNRGAGKPISPTGNEVGKNRVELLSKINFIAKPGELVAIIGPSGSGKTTLLNLISGRAAGQSTGEVLFNGVPVPCRDLKSALTLLPSNDRHLPYLTVHQTLMFSAFLRMAHVSSQERRDAVERIMAELSLTHVRDTQIGGVWKKGLSTGELRRTSIAQELIGDPSVILLDEPTSGLDAVLAYEVVFVLRRLAAAGRTIICSLHQPRSSILQLLDKVVLMANGQILYQGEPKAARAYFETHVGRVIGRDQNIADAMIDIASNIVDECDDGPKKDDNGLSIRETSLSLQAAAKYETSTEARVVRDAIQDERSRPGGIKPKKTRNAIVRWFAEVGAVTYRSWINTCGNPLAICLLIFIQAAVGTLLGAMFYKMPHKYMPEVIPIAISDPSSAPMTIIKSETAQFLTTGIDQKGTNPLLNLITDGADGNGSFPLDILLGSAAPVYLANMLPCTHNRLGLASDPSYAEADFTKFYDLWEGANDASDFAGGPWSAPHVASSLLMTLQVADHTLMKSTWFEYWRYCRSGKPADVAMLACYGCVSGALEFLGAACECTGLPPMPTQSTSCRNGVDEDVDTFPWPDGWPKSLDHSEQTIDHKRLLQERVVDLDGVADAASARNRKLQASALIGGSVDSLAFLLPPQVTKLATVADEYLDALRICAHPACKIMVESVDGEGAAASNTFSDYGKVLGTTLQLAGALFFAATELGFASYDGLLALSGERAMVNREMANHLYRPSTYIIGKSLADFIFQLMPAICLITAYYLLMGVDVGPGGRTFWCYFGICICIVFGAYGFAYFMSALMPTMDAAVVAAPLIICLLVCVSGYFVRDSTLPRIVHPLQWISVYRWGFFALTMNQFPPGGSYGGIPNTFTLTLVGIPKTTIPTCCIILLAIGLGFRFCAYLSLKFLHKHEGVE